MVNLEQTDWGKEDINYFERASQFGFSMTQKMLMKWLRTSESEVWAILVIHEKNFEIFRARDPDIFHLYHDSTCGKIKDRQVRFLVRFESSILTDWFEIWFEFVNFNIFKVETNVQKLCSEQYRVFKLLSFKIPKWSSLNSNTHFDLSKQYKWQMQSKTAKYSS